MTALRFSTVGAAFFAMLPAAHGQIVQLATDPHAAYPAMPSIVAKGSQVDHPSPSGNATRPETLVQMVDPLQFASDKQAINSPNQAINSPKQSSDSPRSSIDSPKQSSNSPKAATTDKTPARRPVEIPAPGTMLLPNEEPIDLATALSLAGSQNPELMAARERLTEASALRMYAAAQILPNINIGVNYDLHRGPLQQSNGNILKVHRDAVFLGLGANAVAAGSVNIPGVQYNLNICESWYQYLQSKQRVARSSAATRTANNNVMLDVCLAYSELLRSEGRRAVLRKNWDEMAEVTRMTTVYARAGQGRQADADRATVELRKREAQLAAAEAETLVASARLCQLINLDPTGRLKPIDGYVVPSPIVPDQVPVAELIAIAMMRRPELAECRAEIGETFYALASARKLPFSPTAMVGFSAGGFGGGSDLISTPPGFIGGDGQQTLTARFGNMAGRTDLDVIFYWTLQNLGVGNHARVRAAASVNRQARWKRVETLNRVRSEVAQAHAMLNSNARQIDTLQSAVESGTDAFREDLKRIRSREGLPIEVIDSLKLLAESRLQYLDAIIDYNRAQFELYVSMGQPPANQLMRPVPAELTAPSNVLNNPSGSSSPVKADPGTSASASNPSGGIEMIAYPTTSAVDRKSQIQSIVLSSLAGNKETDQ